MGLRDKLTELEMAGRAFMQCPKKMDEKGTIDMGQIIMAIIAIVIGAILVGALLPTAVNNVTGGRNGSWSTSLLNTWDAIPLMIVVAGLLVFVAVIIRLSRA